MRQQHSKRLPHSAAIRTIPILRNQQCEIQMKLSQLRSIMQKKEGSHLTEITNYQLRQTIIKYLGPYMKSRIEMINTQKT